MVTIHTEKKTEISINFSDTLSAKLYLHPIQSRSKLHDVSQTAFQSIIEVVLSNYLKARQVTQNLQKMRMKKACGTFASNGRQKNL